MLVRYIDVHMEMFFFVFYYFIYASKIDVHKKIHDIHKERLCMQNFLQIMENCYSQYVCLF